MLLKISIQVATVDVCLTNQEAKVGAYLTNAGDAWDINEDISIGLDWSKNGLVKYTNSTNFNKVEQFDLGDPWVPVPIQK